MNTHVDELVRSLAARQHGVFHLGQIEGQGLTRPTRERRVHAGIWLSLYAGIYRFGGAPRSGEGDVLAACWAGGPRAVASHRTAAALWGLPGQRREPIEITCPRWRRDQSDGLIVHESKVIGGADPASPAGIPVSTVPRTLLDLGAVVPPPTVDLAIDNALRRDLTSLAELHETVTRLGRSGRNGVGVLRTLLDERGVRAPTESEMESRLLAVIKSHGLPAPVVQFIVRTESGAFIARVDAAYPDAKIALEYESFEHHVGKAALVRDSARRNALTAVGWTVITATAVDLRNEGQQLCNAIRACLERNLPGFRRQPAITLDG